MVVVETLAPGDSGQEAPVGRGVLEVPGATPMAQRVDEGSDHDDIQTRVQESGNEAGGQSPISAQSRPSPTQRPRAALQGSARCVILSGTALELAARH